MISIFSQIIAVIRLTLASIPSRLLMSLATIIAVAVAVGVFVGFGALANGFSQTLNGSGSRDVAIVLRGGSGAEINSVLTRDAKTVVEGAPGIARDAKGQPLISGELYVIMDGIRRSTNSKTNIPFRGMTAEGLAVRRGVRLAEGRMFAPGAGEIVVGAAMIREFSGFEFGRTVRLRGSDWKIVGVFEAPGTVFESEIWADAAVVQTLFNRGSSVQVLRVKLAEENSFEAFKKFVSSDPRLQLEVMRENDYYRRQSQGGGNFISFLGLPLGIVMAIGALAGALNTMYSSVSARATETATLRIIGFSGISAFFGAIAEAMVLAAIGAVLGLVACYFLFNGLTTSTLGGGFTQVVFRVQMSWALVGQAFMIAAIIGLVGGVPPAIRAARQSPQLALGG